MTSLVADFIFNPVIRQARRFSRSSNITLDTCESLSPPPTTASDRPDSQADVISETEEGSCVDDGHDDRRSSMPASSRSSVQLSPANIAAYMHDVHGPSHDTSEHGEPTIFDLPIREAESEPVGSHPRTESPSAGRSTMAETASASNAEISLRRAKQRREPLPEDDGMGILRKRIQSVQAQPLGAADKARLVHDLLIEGYTKSRSTAVSGGPLTPSSPGILESRSSPGPLLDSFKFWQNTVGDAEPQEHFSLTDEDIRPTFASWNQTPELFENSETREEIEYRPLGCDHYRRNVKLQCSTCNRWYTCRFCHDKVEDHALVRTETKHMLCMFCGTAQKAGETCVACGASAARYYCGICKLWNDDPDKPVYHCNDCGICRIGRGLGKDFFHCKKCCACMVISKENDHRCIERVTDCDCPICGDYMFTSPKAVCFMKCGHSIHRQCLEDYMQTSYKCPICSKSLANMESQFRNLDLAIQTQPMPAEFQDTRAVVLCNDCSAKTSTKYHWLGLKCSVCLSYNTAQLQILGSGADAIETGVAGPSAHTAGLANLGSMGVDDIAEATGARGIRRRHSSNARSTPAVEPALDSLVPDRLARSVSPGPVPGPSLQPSMATSVIETEDEDENEQDFIGLWSRVPRSITSNGGDGDSGSSVDDSAPSSDEDDLEDEGDESDEDEFELLGHR
ncbi:hypothetical protein F4778DRAFT_455671 [Xylariomycetidae sp. FL2044]|nr:hypothetical protein F4778DRAFT_455671 [Xylariomycetidae sp. FL2044]